MEHLHQLMGLIDEQSHKLGDGSYLEMCNMLQKLHSLEIERTIELIQLRNRLDRKV